MSAVNEISLGSLRVFCLTAEAQSFTQAAQLAGATPAAVSRLISRLEHSLRVQLFVRSTRRVRLTEAGRLYYLECKLAAGELVEVLSSHGGASRPFSLIYPSNVHSPRYLKTCVDFLVARLSR